MCLLRRVFPAGALAPVETEQTSDHRSPVIVRLVRRISLLIYSMYVYFFPPVLLFRLCSSRSTNQFCFTSVRCPALDVVAGSLFVVRFVAAAMFKASWRGCS